MRITVGLAAACSLIASSSARSETFDVHIMNVCDGPTRCQDPDDLLLTFENVNLRWSNTGISFRPTIETVENELWRSIDGFDDDEAIADFAAFAQSQPERITAFSGYGTNSICWARKPQREGSGSPSAYEFICYGGMGGHTWAHELGHFFCLGHPFTFEDRATHTPVDRDGDNLEDTPSDPGKREDGGGPGQGDEADEGPNREWCETETLHPTTGEGEPVVYRLNNGFGLPGHPMLDGCSVQCVETNFQGEERNTSFSPLTENGMSYYTQACYGPYVLDGERKDFFTPDQVERIAACRSEEAERAALVDVCAGIGDRDHDGLCDDEDPCPDRLALARLDVDEDDDGIIDGCDVCPGAPGNGSDTDDDGFCNDIDVDDDNDGCRDNEDKHPFDRMLATAYIFYPPECEELSHIEYTFEGLRAENGVPLCKKSVSNKDLDDDGIDDDQDWCPTVPGMTECFEERICVPDLSDWRFGCNLGGCHDWQLERVSSVYPPDLYREIEIVNDVIYVKPDSKHVTASMIARSLQPQDDTEIVTLHLRQRAPTGTPTGEVVVIGDVRPLFVASYDATTFASGSLRTRGTVVALSPPLTNDDASPVRTEIVWGVGLDGDIELSDEDADGIPDMNDNCLARANIAQNDADQDGFGDACDADLDGDGRVHPSDLLSVVGALGSRAAYDYVAKDNVDGDEFEIPATQRMFPRHFIAAADQDGDGAVGVLDVVTTAHALFDAPGPSGIAAAPPTTTSPPTTKKPR
jgi:hypothetical protein